MSSERGDSSGPGCLGILLIIGLIAIVGGAIGDLFGGGDDDKPANRADNGPFVVSSSSVEQLVTDTGSGEDPDARCDDRRFCEVSYRVEIIGIDTDQELVLAQNEVWKGMFDDPQFDGGVITLRGPVPRPRSASAPRARHHAGPAAMQRGRLFRAGQHRHRPLRIAVKNWPPEAVKGC